ERLDAERVREVVLQPPDCLGDPVGRGAGRGDLAQPRPLRAGEYAVGDLAEHERRPVVRRPAGSRGEPRGGRRRPGAATRPGARGRGGRGRGGVMPSARSSPTTAGSSEMRTARYGRPGDASTTRAATGRSTDTRSDWAQSRRYVSSARSTSFAPWATTHRDGSYTRATRSEGAENRDSRRAGTAESYPP